jgi:hypothetical protein
MSGPLCCSLRERDDADQPREQGERDRDGNATALTPTPRPSGWSPFSFPHCERIEVAGAFASS